MKKLLFYILILCIFIQPSFAQEKTKIIGQIKTDFTVETIGKYISIYMNTPYKIDDNLKIPKGSIVNIYIENTSKEKRFHKSGFFIGKLIDYTTPIENKKNIIEDRNILVVGRKYEEMNATDIARTGTEFTITTIAGFVIPGSDIAYYFTKGAIINDTGKRFKSGVHCAYDNSILWLILKGKPINLQKGDYIILKVPKKSELKILEEHASKIENNDKIEEINNNFINTQNINK